MAYGRRKKYSRFRYRAIEDAAGANSVALGTSTSTGGGSDSVVTVVDGTADLPGFDQMVAGTFAYSNTNTTLYYTNGTGWFKVSTVNESPTVTLDVTSVGLGASGNTALITFTVTEPEGAPWYATVSNTGIANTSQGNVVYYEANNTIEINNFANSENLWTGNVDIQVSDGINIAYARATIKVSYSAGDPRYLVPYYDASFTGTEQWKRWIPTSAPTASNLRNLANATYQYGIVFNGGMDYSKDLRWAVWSDFTGNDLWIYDRGTSGTGMYWFGGGTSTMTHKNITNANLNRQYDCGFPIFSKDGSKIYVALVDEITEITSTTGTPYDFTTYTYKTWYCDEDKSASYANQTAWPGGTTTSTWGTDSISIYGHNFSGDGTKYYTATSTGYVVQWELSTAWDLSTASYVRTSADMTQISNGRSIWFNVDGTVMSWNDLGSDQIDFYYLTTPWDVSTLTYAWSISTSSFDAASQAHWMDPYCTKIVLASYSTADDVTEITLRHSLADVMTESGWDAVTNTQSIDFSHDGTKVIVANASTDNLKTATLNTPYDLRSVDTNSFYAPTDGNSTALWCARWGNNGQYVYYCDDSGDSIKRITLSTAYDISSIGTFTINTYDQQYDPGSERMYNFVFNPQGTRVYYTQSGGYKSLEYVDLSTAWDLTSAGSPSVVTFPSDRGFTMGNTHDPMRFTFLDAGRKIMVEGTTLIHVYDIATPYDLSSTLTANEHFNALYMGYNEGNYPIENAGDKFLYLLDGLRLRQFTYNTIAEEQKYFAD